MVWLWIYLSVSFFGIYLGFWGLYIRLSSRQEFLEPLFLKDFFFFRHSIFSHSFQVSDDMNVRPLAIVSVVPKALIIFSALFRLLFLLDHF